MKQGVIYLIINKVNGHKYVGQTTQGTNKRWKQHIDEAMRMSPYPLHKAMRKYGNGNFMIKEIYECREDELDEKKEYYIKKYNTFNSVEGYNTTEETKEKISDKMSGIMKSEEHCNTISKGLDNNEKLHPVRGGFHLAENRGNGKHLATKILSVNIETGEEREWDSISDAAIELTGDRKKNGNIVRAMNKGYKCYGHLWKRLEPSKQYIKVYGVHKITWVKTQIYDSIREAGRIYGNESAIRKSIKNPRRNSYKGYYWFKVSDS